mgnify:CR=1 FL=1
MELNYTHIKNYSKIDYWEKEIQSVSYNADISPKGCQNEIKPNIIESRYTPILLIFVHEGPRTVSGI